MRRALLPLLALGLGVAAPPTAVAQTTRVGLVVGLSQPEPNGVRLPLVQVQDLLNDRIWRTALEEQSFPIRLSFHLEIWRSRQGWIDDFQRAADWSTVIRREPLEGQYRVTRIFLSGTEELRFTTLEDLDRWVKAINAIDAAPQGTGTFYYKVNLRITALSDDDMEELERFLAGEPESQIRPNRSSVGRRIQRFLLRAVGLPLEQLETSSARFTVTRRRQGSAPTP